MEYGMGRARSTVGFWRSRALVGYRNWAYDTVCKTNKIITSRLSAWCIKWRDIKLSFLNRSSGTLSTIPCDWLTDAVIVWQALTLPYMPSSTPSRPGSISRVVDIPPDECLRRWASRQGSLTQRQIDRCLFSLGLNPKWRAGMPKLICQPIPFDLK